MEGIILRNEGTVLLCNNNQRKKLDNLEKGIIIFLLIYLMLYKRHFLINARSTGQSDRRNVFDINLSNIRSIRLIKATAFPLLRTEVILFNRSDQFSIEEYAR